MPKSASSNSVAGSSLDMDSADGLSALIDGEADASSVARWCEQWRVDDKARCDWHAYQLIGDVMRSEDLASTGQADSVFLRNLRVRLASEPVIVAPQESNAGMNTAVALDPDLEQVRPAGRANGRRWATPVAVAAGFMAVAGVLLMNGLTVAPTGSMQTLASSGSTPLVQSVAPVNGVQTVSSVVPGAPVGVDARSEPRTVVANGQLIRNARLDRYLAAHKQFGGSSAPGTPLGYLRGASAEAGQ